MPYVPPPHTFSIGGETLSPHFKEKWAMCKGTSTHPLRGTDRCSWSLKNSGIAIHIWIKSKGERDGLDEEVEKRKNWIGRDPYFKLGWTKVCVSFPKAKYGLHNREPAIELKNDSTQKLSPGVRQSQWQESALCHQGEMVRVFKVATQTILPKLANCSQSEIPTREISVEPTNRSPEKGMPSAVDLFNKTFLFLFSPLLLVSPRKAWSH